MHLWPTLHPRKGLPHPSVPRLCWGYTHPGPLQPDLIDLAPAHGRADPNLHMG